MPYHAVDSLASHVPPVLVEIKAWQRSRTHRGTPLCPVCGSDFTVVAASSSAVAHFAHAKGAACPLSAGYAVPFTKLAAIPTDPAVAAALKAQFLAMHVQIFNKCRSLATNLSFGEFRDCFDTFHCINAWEYRDLTIEYVPYILLTFLDLFPVRLPFRRRAFYFLLEPRLNNFGDLWIHPATTAQTVLQVFSATGFVTTHSIHQNLGSFSSVPTRAFAASSLRAAIIKRLTP